MMVPWTYRNMFIHSFFHSFFYLFHQSLQGFTTNLDMDTVNDFNIKILLKTKHCEHGKHYSYKLLPLLYLIYYYLNYIICSISVY
jgi:hypothetical protein